MTDFFSNPTASRFWAFWIFGPLRICQRVFTDHTCVSYSLPQFLAIWNRRFYWKPFVLSFKVEKVRFFTKSFALVVKPKETLKKCAPEFDALCMFWRFLKGSHNPWRKTDVSRKVRIAFCLFSQSITHKTFPIASKKRNEIVDILRLSKLLSPFATKEYKWGFREFGLSLAFWPKRYTAALWFTSAISRRGAFLDI